MRIHKIHFKNLNSLFGTWTIDFTHSEYVSNGIFAITGATGSGKSTLLDAICLALYGRTPRLGKITKNKNEIMSQHTSECTAEIEFDSVQGAFRCTWAQHRARKKADGALQMPHHEIVKLPCGTPIKNQLRRVETAVEEATGMNFERFTRSMLLAQGDFASFLQASPSDRSPILEQITGTQVYSEISMKVYQRASKENELLKQLQQEVEGLRLLSEEESQALQSEVESKDKANEGLLKQLETLREASTWLQNLKTLKADFLELQATWKAFEQEKLKNSPKIEAFKAAERASHLEGTYVKISSLREHEEKERLDLKSCEQDLLALHPQIQQANANLKRTESQVIEAYAAQEQEKKVIQEVRELDLNLNMQKDTLKNLNQEIQNNEAQKQQQDQQVDKITKQKNVALEEQKKVQSFLDKNSKDSRLVEELAGMEQLFCTLDQRKLKIKDAQLLLDQKLKSLKIQQQKLKQSQDLEQIAQTELQQQKFSLKEFLDESGGGSSHKEVNQWHDALADLSVLQQHWNKLEALSGQIKQVRKTLKQQKKLQQHIAQQMTQNESQQKILSQAQKELKKELQHLKKQREEVIQIQSLEEQRLKLIEGKACPLCGAIEHPYSASHPDRSDENRIAIQKAEQTVEIRGQEYTVLQRESAGLTRDKEHSKEEIQKLEMLLQTAISESLHCFKHLNCSEKSDVESQIQRELHVIETQHKDFRKKIDDFLLNQKQEEKLRIEQEQAQERFVKKKQQVQVLKYEAEKMQGSYEHLAQDLALQLKDKEKNYQQACIAIQDFGIKPFQIEESFQILQSLSLRKTAWKAHVQQESQLEKELKQMFYEQEREMTHLKKLIETLAAQTQKQEEKKKQHHLLCEQRHKKYGVKNPDQEEKKGTQNIQNLEKIQKHALEIYETYKNQNIKLEFRRKSLSESMIQRSPLLLEEEKRWMEERIRNAFLEESEFTEARLQQKDLEVLKCWVHELQTQETALQTRIKDKEEALHREQKKEKSVESVEELQQQQIVIMKEQEILQQELLTLKLKLKNNAEQEQEQKNKRQLMEAQKKEEALWSTLNRLIGSAEGKKFRNFAQGITFEIMIAHANQQLQKMNDRYLLLHDPKNALELNVVDDYQSGKTRSTRNLSGGESFIVSLALALGLSRMSSKKVRVDSLFLDEGFGSLDEESLATALQTLAELQHDGTLIGVISHVAALKEQIPTQIRIISSNSGQSRIVGPGVTSA